MELVVCKRSRRLLPSEMVSEKIVAIVVKVGRLSERLRDQDSILNREHEVKLLIEGRPVWLSRIQKPARILETASQFSETA